MAVRGGTLPIYTLELSFSGHSMMTFTSNIGTDRGGALYCSTNSYITCNGKSFINFNNNRAKLGGAISGTNKVNIKYVSIILNNNTANYGGVLNVDNSNVSFN